MFQLVSIIKKQKTNVDDLDVGMLKTISIDLKKLSDVVSKEVVKNVKFNRLNAKVNSLKQQIPDATTLIYVNQYNTDKQNLEKKMEILRKKNTRR